MGIAKPRRGYMATPNTEIPLNDREPGTVASIAMEQLRSYQGRATYWPMGRHEHWDEWYEIMRTCWCCTVCDPCETLWFVNDPADNVFSYTEDEILTLKVAHIRQAHDVDGSNDGKRTD
jgi:hypothetical protein